jgi:hypothetical protein
MIKFFRNIRQNLLKEGKTANYLKYAIGEIVLVVIGILIALSINNWNEHRKNNKARIYYTHALLADLKKDSLQFSGIVKQLGGDLDKLENIGKRISGPLANIDTLNNIIKLEWDPRFGGIPSINQNTFATLTSTGSLDFFDRSLTEFIQNYYQIGEDLKDGQKSFMEFYRNALVPFASNMPLADGESLLWSQIIKPGPLKEALWNETDMIKGRALFVGLTSIQYSMLKTIVFDNKRLLELNQQLVDQLKNSLP